MNDADKASLKRLSLAFVRRFAFIAVPVPAKAVYETILRKEIAPYASPKLDDLCARLVSLFAEPTTGLAKIGLPLGPAIPVAMLKQAKSEFDMDATRTVETVFASVVALYLVPQLQGRPDLHSDALALITPLLGPGSAEFEIILGVWTGGAG
jgi:5-methylcytosine-specific restriction protein B